MKNTIKLLCMLLFASVFAITAFGCSEEELNSSFSASTGTAIQSTGNDSSGGPSQISPDSSSVGGSQGISDSSSQTASDSSSQSASESSSGGGSHDEHNFSKVWSSDLTSHWHACLDSGCNEKADVGTHTFDAGMTSTDGTATVYICTVCGYEKVVEIPHESGESLVCNLNDIQAAMADGSVTLAKVDIASRSDVYYFQGLQSDYLYNVIWVDAEDDTAVNFSVKSLSTGDRGAYSEIC